MTDDQSTILLSAAKTTLTTSFKAQSTAVTVRAEHGSRVTARGSSQLANVFKVTPRVRRRSSSETALSICLMAFSIEIEPIHSWKLSALTHRTNGWDHPGIRGHTLTFTICPGSSTDIKGPSSLSDACAVWVNVDQLSVLTAHLGKENTHKKSKAGEKSD